MDELDESVVFPVMINPGGRISIGIGRLDSGGVKTADRKKNEGPELDEQKPEQHRLQE